MVSALNTVPGVRMEERSPGSYRLSIRGSLLRSPFGVRDVKVYYDEIPLTDAGGNTYLNAIDVNSVQGIEVLKGPDGSLFGANSGGVVLVNPFGRNTDSYVSAGLSAGSYGLFMKMPRCKTAGQITSLISARPIKLMAGTDSTVTCSAIISSWRINWPFHKMTS